MKRPCLTCGEPSPESYCEEHQPQSWADRRDVSARARGYSTAWDKLSRRARRMQPWCTDAALSPCSGPLTTDHTPEAWERAEAGLPIRLSDVDVVCQRHNDDRGSSRPGSERARENQGTGAPEGSPGLRGKAQGPLHTFAPYIVPGGDSA